jgi:transposase
VDEGGQKASRSLARRVTSGARVLESPVDRGGVLARGYDTNAFRAFLKQNGIRTVIPGKSNRKKRIRHDKEAYKGRNVIERCFCRLKDWRRIATRYDKLARNYFSALCFVAMLAYWL